jgi:hypothetical protein
VSLARTADLDSLSERVDGRDPRAVLCPTYKSAVHCERGVPRSPGT